MYSLGLETIAGAKLLQVKFGSAGRFQPDQSVVYGDRRARFVRMHDGAAVVRHPGASSPVTVPLDALSLPTPEPDSSRRRPPVDVATRPSSEPLERQISRRTRVRWLPSHQQRPMPHP